MTTALLYVSRICLAVGSQNCSIDDVCRTIAERCEQKSISGAMICIGDSLAQFMEGPDADLRDVISDQQQDDWHESGVVAFDEHIDSARFPDWTLAYSGSSYFIADRVRPLLDASISVSERRARAVELIKLIANFRLDD